MGYVTQTDGTKRTSCPKRNSLTKMSARLRHADTTLIRKDPLIGPNFPKLMSWWMFHCCPHLSLGILLALGDQLIWNIYIRVRAPLQWWTIHAELR
jgi:hypothetical protein